MKELLEKLDSLSSTYDIILDPEVGPMELQELGLNNQLEYNQRDRFAYAQDLSPQSLKQIISDTADNLGIRADEPEIEDKITEKIYKSFIEFKEIDDGVGLWLTFWYDAQVGHLHRQAKIELYVKPHEEAALERFEYIEVRKKIWIQIIAEEMKVKYEDGIELEQLNDYIKERGLLWLLEDMMDIGYDLWDLVEEINDKIEKL